MEKAKSVSIRAESTVEISGLKSGMHSLGAQKGTYARVSRMVNFWRAQQTVKYPVILGADSARMIRYAQNAFCAHGPRSSNIGSAK